MLFVFQDDKCNETTRHFLKIDFISPFNCLVNSVPFFAEADE